MSVVYEKIRSRLMEEARRDGLFHAYIFEGDASSGKEQLARELSAELLQTKNPESSVDFFRLSKSDQSIEAIRKMIADSFVAPFKGKKVYVIEEASSLSVIMQNALLKTLEEVPQHAVFILLCDNASALLDTVRSRCICYYIPPSEDVQSDEEAPLLGEEVRDFYEAVCAKDLVALMRVTDRMKAVKQDREEWFRLLLETAGQILHIRERVYDEEVSLDRGSCSFKLLKNCADELTVFEVLQFIDIIESARKKIGSRCAAGIVSEVMLFDILEVLECQK